MLLIGFRKNSEMKYARLLKSCASLRRPILWRLMRRCEDEMTSTVFVLLMIWSTSSSNGGVAVVQQEFNSLAACEAARSWMAKGNRVYIAEIRAQGCFKK